MYLQINTVKYNADWEITIIYENLQTVWSQLFTDGYYLFIFGLLQISIDLSVFRFVANEYQWRAIWLLLTICNIQSAIWWAILKVILNYSHLPSSIFTQLVLGLTLEHVKLVVEWMAKFHGLSHVMVNQYPGGVQAWRKDNPW